LSGGSNFKAKSLSQRFVLNVPLLDAPANCREHILRTLLSDPDRVLRFLLLLLIYLPHLIDLANATCLKDGHATIA
jgi:hypothetical protein